jgi:hypothetical protein
LVEVDGVATGLMKISKEAALAIWDASEPYTEEGKAGQNRMVFEVKVIDGVLWSEDILFCQKWRDLGGKIFIDPKIICGHSGEKRWICDFSEWIKVVLAHNEQQKQVQAKSKGKEKPSGKKKVSQGSNKWH